MKPPKKTHISFALYLFCERKGRLLGRYKTLIEAYEVLSKIKLTLGKPTYDLVDYAELEEHVWADNQWVHSDTIGIYELSGTQRKLDEVKNRITKEYNELKR